MAPRIIEIILGEHQQPHFEEGMNFSPSRMAATTSRAARSTLPARLTPARRWRCSFIAAAQTGDTFRDLLQPDRRQFLSGSVLWEPSDRARVIASLTFAHQENQTDRGIIATTDADGDVVVNLPRDRFLGERWATTESSRYEFNYRIEHELADWLTICQFGH